jgi:hypothetical protein
VNAPPASFAQIIESAVSPPNAARHAPAATASGGIGRRGKTRAARPTITIHQTAIVTTAISSLEYPPFE